MKRIAHSMFDIPVDHNKENDPNLANLPQSLHLTTSKKHPLTTSWGPQVFVESSKLKELKNFLMDSHAQPRVTLEGKYLQAKFHRCCQSEVPARWLRDYSRYLTNQLVQ
jgi:hypothetical protein